MYVNLNILINPKLSPAFDNVFNVLTFVGLYVPMYYLEAFFI